MRLCEAFSRHTHSRLSVTPNLQLSVVGHDAALCGAAPSAVRTFLQASREGTAEEKELWILYDGNRASLRSELYSKSGDVIQLKQQNGETINASKQDIQEIEELRNQLTEKLRPSVYAELETAPFVSSSNPEMRASWPRCPECRKPIKPQWRMIVKNDKEHPLKIEEIGPYWNQSIAMGQKTIPQDHRFISYPELHQLEEHPSKSDVSLEDWQAFLGNE
jgi:hypothetical protein